MKSYIIKAVLFFSIFIILIIGLFGCTTSTSENIDNTGEICILRLPPCERYVDLSFSQSASIPYIVTKNDCSKSPTEYTINKYDKHTFSNKITFKNYWFKIVEQ